MERKYIQSGDIFDDVEYFFLSLVICIHAHFTEVAVGRVGLTFYFKSSLDTNVLLNHILCVYRPIFNYKNNQ